MLIDHIMRGVEFASGQNTADIRVDGITDDSRSVRHGYLFVAVRGHAEDGARYIRDAIDKGANAVVSEKDFTAPARIVKIIVKDARQALSAIAANYYGHPSGKLNVIGVTGTNGKTTVTYIIESILKSAGHRTGVIGTVNYRIGNDVLPANNTTPGSFELQSLLSRMAESGVQYAIMEVSSHSLDQGRVAGVSFDAAIFTNLTSDHLDYHKTRENYFLAKARIFGHLKGCGAAILNADDAKVIGLAGRLDKRAHSFGVRNEAEFRAECVELSIGGSRFNVASPDGHIRVETSLMGLHNVSNILASIAACRSVGIDYGNIVKGVRALSHVPGRLEPVRAGQDFMVFVDYAHTEDALANALGILKAVATGRIITVFGCGGDRDRTKRPLMGAVSCGASSKVFLTSDNPRTEDPLAIIRDIENGIKGRFANYEIVPDRRMAIEKALKAAEKDDIVLIAGKGHEDYQVIGKRKYHFDDREAARDVLDGCRV